MDKLRRNAAEAKTMLGDTGALRRVASLAVIYKGDLSPDDWVVESVDASGEDEVFFVIFAGPCARERALEYAREKYSGFQIHEPRRNS